MYIIGVLEFSTFRQFLLFVPLLKRFVMPTFEQISEIKCGDKTKYNCFTVREVPRLVWEFVCSTMHSSNITAMMKLQRPIWKLLPCSASERCSVKTVKLKLHERAECLIKQLDVIFNSRSFIFIKQHCNQGHKFVTPNRPPWLPCLSTVQL